MILNYYNHVYCSNYIYVCLLLDFKITFEEANYTVTKNGDVVVKLLLIYPEEYAGYIMFPINVTVDEISNTATGESQSV